MKNTKVIACTEISSYDEGEWVYLQNIEKPKNDHEMTRNEEKRESSSHQGNDSLQP